MTSRTVDDGATLIGKLMMNVRRAVIQHHDDLSAFSDKTLENRLRRTAPVVCQHRHISPHADPERRPRHFLQTARGRARDFPTPDKPTMRTAFPLLLTKSRIPFTPPTIPRLSTSPGNEMDTPSSQIKSIFNGQRRRAPPAVRLPSTQRQTQPSAHPKLNAGVLTKPSDQIIASVKLCSQVAQLLDRFKLRLHCLFSLRQWATSRRGIIVKADDDVAGRYLSQVPRR